MPVERVMETCLPRAAQLGNQHHQWETENHTYNIHALFNSQTDWLCLRVRVSVCACVRACPHVCLSACVCLCVRAHVCACTCVCDLQVWDGLAGQRGGCPQTLSYCAQTVDVHSCQTGRAATWESSLPTPSWRDPCWLHVCMTSSWSHRLSY